jgi:hypothetical protein
VWVCVRACNVILRRVHETTVAVEKQRVLHISVRACACTYAFLWVRVCVRVCVVHGAGVCLRATSLSNPAGNAPPY